MDELNKRDSIVRGKILTEINDIENFIGELTEDEFRSDLKTQKAVVMSLINIGELSKAFTDNFISANKKVPWKKVQAMRNVAAHKYEIIDMEIVWDTVKVSIAELKDELIEK